MAIERRHLTRFAIVCVIVSAVGFFGISKLVDVQCTDLASHEYADGDEITKHTIEVKDGMLSFTPPLDKAGQVKTEADKKKERVAEWKKTFYCHSSRAEIGIAWFTLCLFVATGGLWLCTYLLARDAKEGAEGQAIKMSDTIKEASRSADAMENVAIAMGKNVVMMQEFLPKQMRAYLGINVGEILSQNPKNPSNLFQAMPFIENYGLTPAKKINWIIDSGFFDFPLKTGFKFPESGNRHNTDGSVMPRQHFQISGPMMDRLPDTEAAVIFIGDKRRLFTWGSVNYEDVYGKNWTTEFCFSVNFTEKNGAFRVYGAYHNEHNDTT